MKHIRSVNEFFDFLRGDDEQDKISLEFIKRLEKVKDENPYEINKLKGDNIPEYISKHYDDVYEVIFDDVILVSTRCIGHTLFFYCLYIDSEEVDCKKRYSEKIFNLVERIHKSNVKRIKLDKLRSNINPAADRL